MFENQPIFSFVTLCLVKRFEFTTEHIDWTKLTPFHNKEIYHLQVIGANAWSEGKLVPRYLYMGELDIRGVAIGIQDDLTVSFARFCFTTCFIISVLLTV